MTDFPSEPHGEALWPTQVSPYADSWAPPSPGYAAPGYAAPGYAAPGNVAPGHAAHPPAPGYPPQVGYPPHAGYGAYPPIALPPAKRTRRGWLIALCILVPLIGVGLM
ncbi:MAG TPA: hypothetical protein VME46_15020, partial [Acidimicrobiales bacterium]|nr:hypothetical protein [Acidimicrobiales bacterium]